MGQYHNVYNMDKRDFLHAHDLGNGLKAGEQVGFPASTSTLLFALLMNSNGRGGGDFSSQATGIGRWAGDRIVIQGDYAVDGDPAFLSEDHLAEFTNISAEVLPLLKEIAAWLEG